MRHCPNCGGEVIVWDSDLQADKCVDCGESWTLEEQEAVKEMGLAEIQEDWDFLSARAYEEDQLKYQHGAGR